MDRLKESQRLLKDEEGGKKRVRERFEDVTLLVLKMDEGAVNKGMKMASRSWKRQENSFFPRIQKKSSPPASLVLA